MNGGKTYKMSQPFAFVLNKPYSTHLMSVGGRHTLINRKYFDDDEIPVPPRLGYEFRCKGHDLQKNCKERIPFGSDPN